MKPVGHGIWKSGCSKHAEPYVTGTSLRLSAARSLRQSRHWNGLLSWPCLPEIAMPLKKEVSMILVQTHCLLQEAIWLPLPLWCLCSQTSDMTTYQALAWGAHVTHGYPRQLTLPCATVPALPHSSHPYPPHTRGPFNARSLIWSLSRSCTLSYTTASLISITGSPRSLAAPDFDSWVPCSITIETLVSAFPCVILGSVTEMQFTHPCFTRHQPMPSPRLALGGLKKNQTLGTRQMAQ